MFNQQREINLHQLQCLSRTYAMYPFKYLGRVRIYCLTCDK
ncbi:hypothetical protein KUCAC02_021806 [Chaenocephalus aceratus]|uniref:Uncharacterized protein n=1 Tax=Chaenocephalus aceratus TaxID=36190 RepID=A0ACB9XGJ3_CHAAC|nr:hypothetical protein KUCAC02_021806 [Chaenocephalus aceratus]